MVPAEQYRSRGIPAGVSRQVVGSPAQAALPCTPAVTMAVTMHVIIATLDDGGIVHVGRSSHAGDAVGIEIEFVANRAMVLFQPQLHHASVTLVMRRALAALMIHQIA